MHYADFARQAQSECKLPNELLLLVKEHIPLADLRTHVCYYHTCRTVASFYGDNSQQAEFWRKSCCMAGIGWLKADSSWKEIAFETIAKDGFCTHPHCGGKLLDWNGMSANSVPPCATTLSAIQHCRSGRPSNATAGTQKKARGTPTSMNCTP